MAAYCCRNLQALGLTTGVFHVEAKYTSHGARLIEVNCRMGGGPVQLINRLVYGVDLVVEQLILRCVVFIQVESAKNIWLPHSHHRVHHHLLCALFLFKSQLMNTHPPYVITRLAHLHILMFFFIPFFMDFFLAASYLPPPRAIGVCSPNFYTP